MLLFVKFWVREFTSRRLRKVRISQPLQRVQDSETRLGTTTQCTGKAQTADPRRPDSLGQDPGGQVAGTREPGRPVGRPATGEGLKQQCHSAAQRKLVMYWCAENIDVLLADRTCIYPSTHIPVYMWSETMRKLH